MQLHFLLTGLYNFIARYLYLKTSNLKIITIKSFPTPCTLLFRNIDPDSFIERTIAEFEFLNLRQWCHFDEKHSVFSFPRILGKSSSCTRFSRAYFISLFVVLKREDDTLEVFQQDWFHDICVHMYTCKY